MKTYQQDLKDLGTKTETFDEAISRIYDLSATDMIAFAKAVKQGKKTEIERRALERVLNMRPCERSEAFNIYYRQ